MFGENILKSDQLVIARRWFGCRCQFANDIHYLLGWGFMGDTFRVDVCDGECEFLEQVEVVLNLVAVLND